MWLLPCPFSILLLLLKSLLSLVKAGFDKLKLSMNVEKSQVISPVEDAWEIVDDTGNVVLTLDQVALYKYLGTYVSHSCGEAEIVCSNSSQI